MADDLESIFAETFAEAGDDTGSDDLSEYDNAQILTGDEDDESEGLDLDGDADDEVEDDVDNDLDDSDDTDGATDESQGFDWDTVKDQQVTVKVDGRDLNVSLEELRNGYMRQADYTRKTQEAATLRSAAEWAQQFQEALQTDPQGTIQFLAETFGVEKQPEIDYESMDPEVVPFVKMAEQARQEAAAVKRELASLKIEQSRTVEAQADEQALAAVKAEVQDLRVEFPDLTDDSLRNTLQLAADRGLTLREAHVLLNADKILTSKQTVAKAKAEADKVADRATREMAKRKASKQKVPGRTPGGKSVDTTPEFDDFGDLLSWELSKNR